MELQPLRPLAPSNNAAKEVLVRLLRTQIPDLPVRAAISGAQHRVRNLVGADAPDVRIGFQLGLSTDVVCKATGNKRLVHVHLVAVIRGPQVGNIGEALNTRPTLRSKSAVGVRAELLGAVNESGGHTDRRDGWAGGGRRNHSGW